MVRSADLGFLTVISGRLIVRKFLIAYRFINNDVTAGSRPGELKYSRLDRQHYPDSMDETLLRAWAEDFMLSSILLYYNDVSAP